MTRWLITQDTDFCQHGREKPLPRYDKRLKCGKGYVEIQLYSNTITCELFLSEKEINNSQHVHSALFYRPIVNCNRIVNKKPKKWVHKMFILIINQLDAQNLFYNKFISCLYMFRAPCAHRQEVKIVLYSL